MELGCTKKNLQISNTKTFSGKRLENWGPPSFRFRVGSLKGHRQCVLIQVTMGTKKKGKMPAQMIPYAVSGPALRAVFYSDDCESEQCNLQKV